MDFSPHDERWKLQDSVYSDELARRMVWLSGWLPYQQCQQVFEQIGERHIPSSSIWRQTQAQGSRRVSRTQQQRQQVSLELVKLPDAVHDHDQRKGVSMDGGMVNLRQRGWCELKVGTVFDVEQRLERDVQTQQLTQQAHATKVGYTAVLGSKDAFAPALWALAVEQHVPTAQTSCVCADGAAWIWNLADEYFPVSRQIVDWFHATQHLADAAHALYPDVTDSHKCSAWLKTYKDHLYMGRLHTIIACLHKRNRADLAIYFEHHQRRMQYLEFREEGLPIGSGTVESGVKQFKQRLTGAGMRWNAPAAERMIVIRAAVLGNTFNMLWDAA